MAKEWAKPFYNSKQWIKCRKAFIAERISIDGGICQRCKDNLGYIVHHKEELTPNNINDPNVTLSFDNLEYVCKVCHDNEHDFGRGNKTFIREGFTFNEMGELVKK